MAGRRIALVTVVVADYDETIGFYTGKLGLLLARAASEEQRARVGDQTGGRVGFFLETDDFARDHAAMLAAGVAFEEEPREELYGTVAVFRNLHGNRFDLIQPRHS